MLCQQQPGTETHSVRADAQPLVHGQTLPQRAKCPRKNGKSRGSPLSYSGSIQGCSDGKPDAPSGRASCRPAPCSNPSDGHHQQASKCPLHPHRAGSPEEHRGAVGWPLHIPPPMRPRALAESPVLSSASMPVRPLPLPPWVRGFRRRRALCLALRPVSAESRSRPPKAKATRVVSLTERWACSR